ncbi:MAG: hemerythrin domain-containing protein [Pseudomonadota bacterium]|nr:hemerythrin domain-containing protein [Pseudomonadota bacterium]
MNNCEQLQKLSLEHQEALLFAAEIARIAAEGSEAELEEGVQRVNRYYESELEEHLQHEEQTIFAPLVQQHKEHIELCITLGKEHGFIRTVIENMSRETARKDLADFARVLKTHSLVEERELFPLLESLFTEEQLNAVLNYVPLRKYADKEQAGVT